MVVGPGPTLWVTPRLLVWTTTRWRSEAALSHAPRACVSCSVTV